MPLYLIAALVFYLLIPLPGPLFKNDYSHVILDRKGELQRVFLNSAEQWIFPPDSYNKLSHKLVTSVLTFEDRFFRYHPGVNPAAVIKAFYRNLRKGEVLSGASTITMQVARLCDPKERTYKSKLLEIFQSFKLELKYSKKELLSYYLMQAPYGGNIRGVESAARKYFNKASDELSWAEAAVLAVLPNSPGLISPALNRDLLIKKRDILLRRLYKRGFIKADVLELALREPAPGRLYRFPFKSPHLSRYLKSHYGSRPYAHTTIDEDLNQRAGELLKLHIEHLRLFDINNMCCLAAETATGKVRIYQGSQDFFDKKNSGEVDGVLAARSSASIFKPFLYALMINEGSILPGSKITDVPAIYNGFAPNNADKNFRGMVSVKDALIRSLNVPSVALLHELGVFPFYIFLKNSGVDTLFRRAEDYGLPLVLGGAEVSLASAAALYAMLGRGGAYRELTFFEKEENKGSMRMLSKGASYQVLEMLRELRRPGSEYYWEQYEDSRPIAWKTGTSYGNRDAWAVGVNPQWTIAVWAGNFDGGGTPDLSGARSAAPLLFDLLNILPRGEKGNWFKEPPGELVELDICPDTGYPASEHCPQAVRGKAPAYTKERKKCFYHLSCYVDQKKEYQVCSLCWGDSPYTKASYLVYPPRVTQYYLDQGVILRRVPHHKKSCPALASGQGLAIIYPEEGTKIFLPRDYDGELQSVILKAAHNIAQSILYWYIDDNYLGETRSYHSKAVKLARGWHNLTVVDTFGVKKSIRFFAGLAE